MSAPELLQCSATTHPEHTDQLSWFLTGDGYLPRQSAPYHCPSCWRGLVSFDEGVKKVVTVRQPCRSIKFLTSRDPSPCKARQFVLRGR